MPGGKPRPKKKRAARRDDEEDANEYDGGRRYYPDEDRGFYPEPRQPLTEEEKAERARQREYDEVEQVRPGEPLIQRWWRLRREGHDPGLHPQAEVTDDSMFGRAMEWFRRAPVMGTLILVFGTLVIVVPIVIISLDDESDEVTDFEIIEDENPDTADTADTADTDTGETEPADPPVDEAPPPTPAEEPDDTGSASVMPASRVIEGAMATECGGSYTVNLTSTRFNNGEEVTDQTFTLGGNALQTASGWGNDFISIMTWTEADFYEVWFFIWNFGDIATILNIYGTSAGFVPPASVADTARFNDIASLSDLTAAIDPSDDSCGGELAIAGVQTNNFPEVG